VTMSKRTVAIALSLIAATLGLAACGSSGGGAASTLRSSPTRRRRVSLKADPAFQATSEGKGVSFSQSFGPSGEQSRSVANGLHADVVKLSLAPERGTAREGGACVSYWNQNATHGFPDQLGGGDHRAQGQPQHITGWSDLVKPGVQVLTPNPSPRVARAGT